MSPHIPIVRPESVTCGLTHHPYTPGTRTALHLEGGRNMGLGVNLLRARISDDEPLAETVQGSAPAEDIVASTIELVLAMAFAFCGPMIEVTNQSAGEDPDQDAVWAQMEMVTRQHKTAVFLLNLAMNFHDDAVEHISGCATCAADTDSCPLVVDEQLVRDLADAIAAQAGHEITRIVVGGIGIGHVLDVAITLAQATRMEREVPFEEQLSVLSALPLQLVAQHESSDKS